MYDEASPSSQAYSLDSSDFAVNNNIGIVYLHKELYNDSIKHLVAAIKAQPGATDARYNLGIAYIETSQDDLAITTLNELIKIRPDYYDAYYRLGHLYIKKGDQKKASDTFKILLDKKPDYEKRNEITGLIY
jgi:tetratricopeptide (TPR) repeat protein